MPRQSLRESVSVGGLPPPSVAPPPAIEESTPPGVLTEAILVEAAERLKDADLAPKRARKGGDRGERE